MKLNVNKIPFSHLPFTRFSLKAPQNDFEGSQMELKQRPSTGTLSSSGLGQGPSLQITANIPWTFIVYSYLTS